MNKSDFYKAESIMEKVRPLRKLKNKLDNGIIKTINIIEPYHTEEKYDLNCLHKNDRKEIEKIIQQKVKARIEYLQNEFDKL